MALDSKFRNTCSVEHRLNDPVTFKRALAAIVPSHFLRLGPSCRYIALSFTCCSLASSSTPVLPRGKPRASASSAGGTCSDRCTPAADVERQQQYGQISIRIVDSVKYDFNWESLKNNIVCRSPAARAMAAMVS